MSTASQQQQTHVVCSGSGSSVSGKCSRDIIVSNNSFPPPWLDRILPRFCCCCAASIYRPCPPPRSRSSPRLKSAHKLLPSVAPLCPPRRDAAPVRSSKAATKNTMPTHLKAPELPGRIPPYLAPALWCCMLLCRCPVSLPTNPCTSQSMGVDRQLSGASVESREQFEVNL